jgi:hypothetical protein
MDNFKNKIKLIVSQDSFPIYKQSCINSKTLPMNLTMQKKKEKKNIKVSS